MANKTTATPGASAPDSGFRVRYIFYFVAVVLGALAVFSYSAADADALAGGVDAPPKNLVGMIGAFLGCWAFELFGLAAYVLVILLMLRAIRSLLPGRGRPLLSLTGEALVLFGLVLLLALVPDVFVELMEKRPLGLGRRGIPALALSGGVIGQVLSAPGVEELGLGEGVLRRLIGTIGTMILGWALLTGGLLIVYFADWHALLKEYVFGVAAPAESALRGVADGPEAVAAVPGEDDDAPLPTPFSGGLFGSARAALQSLRDRYSAEKRTVPATTAVIGAADQPELPVIPEPPPLAAAPLAPSPAAPPVIPAAEPPKPPVTPSPMANVAAAAPAVASERPVSTPAEVGTRVVEQGQKAGSLNVRDYTLPPISMLSKGTDVVGEDPEAIVRSREILQRTLDSFKVPGQVSGYISGPRITRYEISLAEGVSVKKVEQIADNIAMNLSAKSVRVLAPIPGRNVVGVEVPNSRPEAVFMRAVMESDAWRDGKAGIPIVLGKDVAGKPVILDLAKAPHLLIAGSTGSGKSVCMNTLITSLLFKFRPDELRLIMVDPKIVEFEDYKLLPHLITPVINESRKVPIALRWAVTEMENRYKILARAGVKKLAEYNSRPASPTPVLDADGLPIPDKMPILIVIIDELAELMMTDARKDSETYIARIAQLGRAAGVHIVVATQRPSTQIVTGVIKANLPTRIAFRVGQMVDSRVILDANGAEKLLGMGDMLFMAPGGMDLERVQGALVADADIKNIVRFVSDQAPQSFNAQVVAEEEEADEEIDPELTQYDDEDRADIAPLIRRYLQPGDDDNIRRALEIVLLDRKASTSYLQRRLKIGYNRAAEIIDLFEERGIVGPPSGSGNKREILACDELGVEE